jgi:hypothetical protein
MIMIFRGATFLMYGLTDGSRVTRKSDIPTASFPPLINRFHIPDHRTAKEHLLKIIVGGEAGCYLIS